MSRTVRARRRTAAASAAVLLGLVGSAVAVTPAPAAPVPSAPIPCPAAYALGSVEPGLIGTGFTVASGTERQPFKIEVLGILVDGAAPGKDIIVAKISDVTGSTLIADNGGTGWAGISGSPVYADGRLLGSVSYGFSGSSPIMGLTPAADLYEVLSKSGSTARSGTAKAAKVTTAQRQQWAARAHTAVPQGSLQPLVTPLAVSGVGRSGLATLQKAVDKIGWNVKVVGTGSARSRVGGAAAATPQAGGNFAGVLSYGDITIGGIGTTTAVCGSQAVAFGHPLEFSGAVANGASDASAVGIITDSAFGSYKLANITGAFGTLDQDRLSGVRANLTTNPALADVVSIVRDTDSGKRRIGTNQVASPDYLPLVAYYGNAFNTQVAKDEAGKGTATSSWTIEGTRRNGNPFVLTRSNQFADNAFISDAAADDLASALDALINNDYETLNVTRVSLASKVASSFQQWHIASLEVAVNGGAYSKPRVLVVKPGDKLSLRVGLQPYRSTAIVTTTMAVTVPTGAGGSSGELTATGGVDAGDDEDTSIECLLLGKCAEGAEAGSLTKLALAIRDAPRNDSVIGTLDLESDKTGKASRAGAVKRQPLTVTGSRSIAVVVR